MQLELHIMWLCVLYMFYMSLAETGLCSPHYCSHLIWIILFNTHFLLYYMCSDLISCTLISLYSFILIGSMLVLCYWCHYQQNKHFQLSFSFCGIPYNIPPIHHNQHKPPSAHLNMAKTCHPICSFWEMACMYHWIFLLRFLFIFRSPMLFLTEKRLVVRAFAGHEE